MFDVKMPDGTIIKNVPEGTTKSALLAKLQKNEPKIKEQQSNWSFKNLADSIALGNKKAALGAIQFFAPDLYPEEMAQQAKELEQQGKGTGTVGLVGELLGDPKNLAMGIGKVGLAGRFLQGATSAAMQPVQGATEEERQAERDFNTKVGGISYAVAPAVIEPVVKGAKYLGKAVVEPIVEAKLPPTQKAQDIILKSMEVDKLQPKQVAEELIAAKKLSPKILTQDIIEKRIDDVPINPSVTKKIGEYASTLGGEDVASNIAKRQNFRIKRIESTLDNFLSEKGVFDLNKAAIANKQQIANNLRQQAVSYPVNIQADDIIGLLKSTKEGNNLLNSINENVKLGVKIGNKQPTTTEYLDALKKGLDRRAKELFNPNADASIKDAAANFTEISNLLKDRLKTQNPIYAEYLSRYGDEIRNQEALEAGKTFLKTPIDELKNKFSQLSNAEKENYLAGVKESILGKIASSTSKTDVPSKFFTNDMRDKLSVLVPAKKQKAFFKILDSEQRMFATDKAFTNRKVDITGEIGDKTAINNLLGSITNALNITPTNVGQNVVLRTFSKNLQAKLGRMDEATAKEITNLLYSNDPNKVLNLQKVLDNKNISSNKFKKAIEDIAKSMNKTVVGGVSTTEIPKLVPNYSSVIKENN